MNKLRFDLTIVYFVNSGVQTPNCIRQTVFDAVAHDYPSIVVLSDATSAASPKVHEGLYLYLILQQNMRNVSHQGA